MKFTSFVFLALGLGSPLPGVAENTIKLGVINIQAAMTSTKDGQKAANELQKRFGPKRAELDKRQTEIGQLQDRLSHGRNALSEDAQQKLVREIEQKTKLLNRDTEDARADLDQEQQKAMSQLGSEWHLPGAIGYPVFHQFEPVQHSGPIRHGLFAWRTAWRQPVRRQFRQL